MEYGYTHGVGGTHNKVKSTTHSFLIGSGVLSIGYGMYFPWGIHFFTPWGRKLGTHPTICSKYLHNSRGFSYLNWYLSIQDVIINMLLYITRWLKIKWLKCDRWLCMVWLLVRDLCQIAMIQDHVIAIWVMTNAMCGYEYVTIIITKIAMTDNHVIAM